MASSTCRLPFRHKSLRPVFNWPSKTITSHTRQIHTTNPSIGPQGLIYPTEVPLHLRPANILTTLHQFPTLAPLKLLEYSPSLLGIPMRKDILHRAIIYEGDSTRQGTANTKWRSDVHGSNRKIRPQKGSGRARLGNKKSPMLRGGGVAFGPKPRDFGTGLQRRVYSLAWRTALSYRYRKGELVVVDSLRIPGDGVEEGKSQWWVKKWMEILQWDRKHAGSVFVTKSKTEGNKSFYKALNEELDRQGYVRSVEDVDVKNLLGMGRVVIERTALNSLLKEHAPAVQKGVAHGLTTGAASEDLMDGFDRAILGESVVDFAEYDLDQETADVEDVLQASEEELDDLDSVYDLAEEEAESPRTRV